MEDLFEMMMQSERLSRGSRRAKKRASDPAQLEGATLREALGGNFLSGNSSPVRDASWLDVDNALAARRTGAEVQEFEDDWEGSGSPGEVENGTEDAPDEGD